MFLRGKRETLKQFAALRTKEIHTALPEVTDHSAEIVRIKTSVDRVRQRREPLLGVERCARSRVDELIGSLEWRMRELEYGDKGSIEARQAAEARMHQQIEMAKRYDRLSLEPFRWRNWRGLPRLACFSIEDPTFEIRPSRCAEFERSSAFVRNLPDPIGKCYADVAVRIYQACSYRCLTCTFGGVIPPEVRQMVRKVQDDFKQILFVAEVANWKVKMLPASQELVVAGWDGFDLYYITELSTTSVEEAGILAVA